MESWEVLAVMALALFAIYCITIERTFVGLITIGLAVLLSPFFRELVGS